MEKSNPPPSGERRKGAWPMEDLRQPVRAVLEQVSGVILGKEAQVQEILLAFLAGGHALLEDVPGVGKTTLALAFSRAMELEHRRVQFTPDVLPSDLTGFSIYRREEERFVYQKGSVFCNLLLADEINRTSPKTQSALLEVMEERRVTVEGVTREVPRPFLVIATQNPPGSAGTQTLPEAQVDRFMVCLSLGYPDEASELKMARGLDGHSRVEAVRPVMDGQGLLRAQAAVCAVYASDAVLRYAVRLVRATREHPLLERGGSPRATIALVQLARAAAWLDGRDFVAPEDVAGRFLAALRHRVRRSAAARAEGLSRDEALARILAATARPALSQRA